MIPSKSSLEATSIDYPKLVATEYNVRYSKIRCEDNSTAILIRLIVKENGSQNAA
jgi:hypothetical protein